MTDNLRKIMREAHQALDELEALLPEGEDNMPVHISEDNQFRVCEVYKGVEQLAGEIDFHVDPPSLVVRYVVTLWPIDDEHGQDQNMFFTTLPAAVEACRSRGMNVVFPE